MAMALGATVASVYVTGRSQREGDAALPGNVFATAQQIDERGGKGIAAVCNRGGDKQVEALFEQIEAEHGRLDILVNNALMVPDELAHPSPAQLRSASWWFV